VHHAAFVSRFVSRSPGYLRRCALVRDGNDSIRLVKHRADIHPHPPPGINAVDICQTHTRAYLFEKAHRDSLPRHSGDLFPIVAGIVPQRVVSRDFCISRLDLARIPSRDGCGSPRSANGDVSPFPANSRSAFPPGNTFAGAEQQRARGKAQRTEKGRPNRS